MGAQRRSTGCQDLPVEIHAFLCELPIPMVRVLEGLVLDDLHPFSSVALFVAVLADHVQLSDFVLQNTQTQRGQTHRSPPKTAPAPPPPLRRKQLRASALPVEKRKQARGPDGTLPQEEGGERAVSRMQKRPVPVNTLHHLGRCLPVWPMAFKGWQPINQPMGSGQEVGTPESPFPLWPYRVKWR